MGIRKPGAENENPRDRALRRKRERRDKWKEKRERRLNGEEETLSSDEESSQDSGTETERKDEWETAEI